MNITPSNAIIGVVGAGAMGSGIAQVAMLHGHQVMLTDAEPAALARSKDGIRQALARDVEKGRRSSEDASAALGRLTLVPPSPNANGLSTCHIIIEAVVERLDVKQALLRSLEVAVPAETVFATNTSSLSIASIAAVCTAPQRVLGVHFFNPAVLMPLVEIIPGVRTSPAVTDWAITLVQGWGKVTALAKDTPGFIVNRIARPYYGEALRIADEGIATPETIDWAMKSLGGFRMGPFELMDFIGHDVNYVVTETVWTAMYHDPRYRPSITQKRLLEAGLLGKKSGRGFYDYATGSATPEPVTDPALGAAIVERVVAMLINEAVDAVYLQVASAEAIDLAMTRGVSYPKGLLAWGDELGWPRVLAALDALRAEYGEERYRASPLLRRMARDGSRFFA